jgi:hypothetical protein
MDNLTLNSGVLNIFHYPWFLYCCPLSIRPGHDNLPAVDCVQKEPNDTNSLGCCRPPQTSLWQSSAPQEGGGHVVAIFSSPYITYICKKCVLLREKNNHHALWAAKTPLRDRQGRTSLRPSSGQDNGPPKNHSNQTNCPLQVENKREKKLLNQLSIF